MYSEYKYSWEVSQLILQYNLDSRLINPLKFQDAVILKHNNPVQY